MVKSAGLLLYRLNSKKPEVLLIHPGGPFWANKDAGAWSIPKGEFGDDESPLDAAIRETEEEIGKKVKGDFDPSTLKSNSFEIEWPPKSGNKKSFPEADRAEWFVTDVAKEKINAGQVPLISELERKLD